MATDGTTDLQQRNSIRTRRTTFALLALVGVTVALSGFAIWAMMEASEERQGATAAADLRYSALILEAVHGLPVDETMTLGLQVGGAIDQVTQNRDSALHALTPDERAVVNDGLDELVECGEMIQSSLEAPGSQPPPAPEAPDHDHQRLLLLLEAAVDRAQTDADMAERQALAALGAAIVGLGALSWALFRARYDAQAGRSLASTWANASRRVDRLLDDTPDGLLVIDPLGAITYRSDAASNLITEQTTTRDGFVDRFPPAQREALEAHVTAGGVRGASATFRLDDPPKPTQWWEVRVSDLTDDDAVGGHVITLRDVTADVGHRRELRHQAQTDALTGLPNRRRLESMLIDASRQLTGNGGPVAFAVIDFDRFKDINDTLGHQAGDVVLRNAADRLRRATPSQHVLLRLGGDEFGVMFAPGTPAAATKEQMDRIISVLSDPFDLGLRVERINSSVGLAITDDPDAVPDLLAKADIAMYEAKRAGGDRVVVFQEPMAQRASTGTQIMSALRNADYNSEFRMVYQPIVATETRKIVAYEALLRWSSPTLGQVSPAEFIPLAEASAQICGIGRWVLNEVCRQVAIWEEMGLDPDLSISVNFSARQLAEPELVPGVLATLQTWGVSPHRITVEVTESAILEHTDATLERLSALRSAGMRISIDDFGAGYSNLGQLLAVPFDVIKIDRSLLLRLSDMREASGGDPEGPCAIMQAIVSIADVMGAPVVCEGVEDEQQRISLAQSGITYIQGFLTGRPMEAAGVLAPTPELLPG